jgi:hypothetical protein
MKNIARYFLVGAVLLSGCDSNNQDEYAGGIEGTGDRVTLASAYGTVSGFGSVHVNGVHFDTDTAEIIIADEVASEDELAVGMVVEVTGEIAANGKKGVAKRVRAERVLLGVIESVDEVGRGRKALKILGQKVYINEDATFVGTNFADLTAGLGVSVSGFVTDNGLAVATYLEQRDIDIETANLEVEGYITSIEPETEFFLLNELRVAFAGAEFVGGTESDLAAGKRVRVKGKLDVEQQILTAARVSFVKDHAAGIDHRVSVEGVIRELRAGSFRINTTLVELQGARIENGSASDIREGAQVVVFGPLVENKIRAERIRIKPVNSTRFKGLVENIDRSSRTFQVIDTDFQVTQFTQYKDDSQAKERHFNFSSLRDGEEVEVFAVSVEGVWQVTRIIRLDQPLMGARDMLRGEISDIDEANRSFRLGDFYIDATEIPPHEWNEILTREGTLNVDVDGFYIDDAQFRATHVHFHPKPPCSPHVFYDCEQKPPGPKGGEAVPPIEAVPPVEPVPGAKPFGAPSR